MLRLNCAQCGRKVTVPDNATAKVCLCRACQEPTRVAVETSVVGEPGIETKSPPPNHERFQRRFIVAFQCIFWLLVLAWLFGFLTPPKEKNAAELRQEEKIAKEVEEGFQKISAWTAAEQFVKQHLKSPSTASFGGPFSGDTQDPRKCVTALGNNQYKIVGWVDSQNSFGATLRTNFQLTVQDRGDKNHWDLVETPVFIQR